MQRCITGLLCKSAQVAGWAPSAVKDLHTVLATLSCAREACAGCCAQQGRPPAPGMGSGLGCAASSTEQRSLDIALQVATRPSAWCCDDATWPAIQHKIEAHLLDQAQALTWAQLQALHLRPLSCASCAACFQTAARPAQQAEAHRLPNLPDLIYDPAQTKLQNPGLRPCSCTSCAACVQNSTQAIEPIQQAIQKHIYFQ